VQNEFKGDYWQPASLQRILHPLRDNLSLHIVEEENGKLKALTDTGTFHIDRLHLNREALIGYRSLQGRRQATRLLQAHLLERLKDLEEQVRVLVAELSELQAEDE
jgi:hypothetical protein